MKKLLVSAFALLILTNVSHAQKYQREGAQATDDEIVSAIIESGLSKDYALKLLTSNALSRKVFEEGQNSNVNENLEHSFIMSKSKPAGNNGECTITVSSVAKADKSAMLILSKAVCAGQTAMYQINGQGNLSSFKPLSAPPVVWGDDKKLTADKPVESKPAPVAQAPKPAPQAQAKPIENKTAIQASKPAQAPKEAPKAPQPQAKPQEPVKVSPPVPVPQAPKQTATTPPPAKPADSKPAPAPVPEKLPVQQNKPKIDL